jgi:hypothetical protein
MWYRDVSRAKDVIDTSGYGSISGVLGSEHIMAATRYRSDALWRNGGMKPKDG